jgi:predicted ATPase
VAEWLRDLGLILAFELQPIAENRKEYEVRVQRSVGAPWVLITDVSFGVSQILPVLVLCYFAPEGATLVFEQPEIHLHPSVQAGLADLFIDVIKTRKMQISPSSPKILRYSSSILLTASLWPLRWHTPITHLY